MGGGCLSASWLDKPVQLKLRQLREDLSVVSPPPYGNSYGCDDNQRWSDETHFERDFFYALLFRCQPTPMNVHGALLTRGEAALHRQ